MTKVGDYDATRNLFYKGQMEFSLVLSLIFQYTFLTALEHNRLVYHLAVPDSLSLIKHTACSRHIDERGAEYGGAVWPCVVHISWKKSVEMC